MLLLPYQKRWLSDRSPVKVCEKSRRIGLTWSTALEAVLTASSDRGSDVYYMGYNQDLAVEFVRNCGDWSRHINEAMKQDQGKQLFEDYKDDQRRAILSKTIRFPSGYRIQALTSHPRNLRGKQGYVIIDEAAFHDDLAGILKAALSTMIWGGRIAVISTHDGVTNPFNQLVQDIVSRKKDYSHHRITLDDAISEGLYRQVARVRGLSYTPEAEQEWRKAIVDMHGEVADEELFCVPSKSTGVYIQPSIVERALKANYKVIRYELPPDFSLKDEGTREKIVADWYSDKIKPFVSVFDKSKGHYIGQDFGRKSDLSAIAVGTWSQNLHLEVPLIIELQNIPFEQQKFIVNQLADDLPNFSKAAVDATGNGSYLAEVFTQKYGPTLVESVMLSEKWYCDNMPIFRSRFEDDIIHIPRDYDVKQDLLMFEYVNGVPKLPKIRKEGKVNTTRRHGDSAVALVLLEYASRIGAREYGYEKVPRSGIFGGRAAMW